MLKLTAEVVARLGSGALAGPSLLPASVDASLRASEVCSNISQWTQIRTKVYTPNVMNAERSKRILNRRNYGFALREWRKEVNHRLQKWRAEMRASEIEATTIRRSQGPGLSEHAQHAQSQSQEHQNITKLEEELRRAQLDHDVAVLRLEKARRSQEREAKQTLQREARYQELLEASRQWVADPEELKKRIAAALDNPRPFGFITNLPRTTL